MQYILTEKEFGKMASKAKLEHMTKGGRNE